MGGRLFYQACQILLAQRGQEVESFLHSCQAMHLKLKPPMLKALESLKAGNPDVAAAPPTPPPVQGGDDDDAVAVAANADAGASEVAAAEGEWEGAADPPADAEDAGVAAAEDHDAKEADTAADDKEAGALSPE